MNAGSGRGDEPVDFVVGEDDPPATSMAAPASRAAEAPGVEFVDEIDGDAPAPVARRTRVTIVAALAVLALVLIGVAVHGRGHTPVAARSSSPTPSPSLVPVTPSFVPGSAIAVSPVLTVPPACPEADDGQSACERQASVPKAFTKAVRAKFAGLRQRSASTEQLRPGVALSPHGLWSRTYLATGKGMTLRIYIRRGTSGNDPIDGVSGDDGAHSTSFGQHAIGPYIVQAQVVTVSGSEVDPNRVISLASDSRLVAVS